MRQEQNQPGEEIVSSSHDSSFQAGAESAGDSGGVSWFSLTGFEIEAQAHDDGQHS